MKKYRKLLALGLAMLLAVMPAMTAFAETEGVTEQQEVEEPKEEAPETENEAPELKEAESEETAVNTPSEAEEPEESEEEAEPEEEELKEKASLLGGTGSDYLTFTAEQAESTVTFKYASADADSVMYSTYEGNEWSSWNSCDSGTTITLQNEGYKVRFKGKNVTTSSGNHFSMTGKIAASGDVTSLTNGSGGDVTLTKGCYENMFDGCKSLTTAPNLPAGTLAEECYEHMFTDCEALTTAPELPATGLANSCYQGMFERCKNLTTAPELPAKTLAGSCYYYMFSGCTSLTTAPELPAKTLAGNCYYHMFSYCTSLTSAPELPAETLAEFCYNNMFNGCTSLTTAPSLPATDLAKNCYLYMFYSCTSLTTAPELPATSLKYGCYCNMFQGCTSLTTAPELKAETLDGACYFEMFKGCTSLKVAATGNESNKIFTCPDPGALENPVGNMFEGTGSTISGTPEAGTTYYYIPPVTVTFDVQGHGTAPAEKKVMSGGKVTEPTAPTAEGYAFGGWYKEAGCTTKWNFETETVSEDTTLYAKWYNWNTLPSNAYKITLDKESMVQEDAQAIAAQEVKSPINCDVVVYGKLGDNYYVRTYSGTGGWTGSYYKLKELRATVASGYRVFLIGTVDKTFDWKLLTSDTTAITLTDEAMTSDDAKAIVNQMITSPSINDLVVYRKRQGERTYVVLEYSGSAWGDNPGGTLESLKNHLANNKVYVIGTVKEGYTVSFDLNGYGTAAPEDQIVKNGGKVTKPNDPTAEGYAFGGWYKETGCTTAWDFEADTVTADTTLYAKWTKNSTPTPDDPASEPSEEPKPSFTGTQNNGAAGTAENPVTGGQWNCGPGGQWTFRTNGQFKDTWGYIKLDNGQVGWFYFDKNGIMATGWQQVNGKWYYFNQNHDGSYGMMLFNTTTPDGYKLGPDGVWIQ